MGWFSSNWNGPNWGGGYWMGASGGGPVDADVCIEEQILDLIVTKLSGITIANGYEETVVAVTRASVAPAPLELDLDDLPALQVRHLGTSERPHLRDAQECQMQVEIVCMALQDDEVLSDLKADVERLVHANRRWNDGVDNLAVRTWIQDPRTHEAEVDERVATAVIPITIVFRVASSSPYILKAV